MGDKAKILLVDDEADIRDILRIALEQEGYEIYEAADGQEALDQVKQLKPDLVVLDLMLPKVDGYKVCQLLKSDDQYKKIPVLLFTARGRAEEISLAMECGANAYMAKPFEPKKLVAILGALVNASKLAKRWERVE